MPAPTPCGSRLNTSAHADGTRGVWDELAIGSTCSQLFRGAPPGLSRRTKVPKGGAVLTSRHESDFDPQYSVCGTLLCSVCTCGSVLGEVFRWMN